MTRKAPFTQSGRPVPTIGVTGRSPDQSRGLGSCNKDGSGRARIGGRCMHVPCHLVLNFLHHAKSCGFEALPYSRVFCKTALDEMGSVNIYFDEFPFRSITHMAWPA